MNPSDRRRRYVKDWEKWADCDPYYAVLTQNRFQAAVLTDEDRAAFFETGREYVAFLLSNIRSHFDPSFEPHDVVDFGCGVGRLAIAFAETGAEVTAVDVADAMLEELRRNTTERGISTLRILPLNSFIEGSKGSFDLVNAYITFQHIPPSEGTRLYEMLLSSVKAGGYCAVHLLHTRPGPWWKRITGWAKAMIPGVNAASNLLHKRPLATPYMQMNIYDINKFLESLHADGFGHAYCVSTDHGGYRGALIVAQKVEKHVP